MKRPTSATLIKDSSKPDSDATTSRPIDQLADQLNHALLHGPWQRDEGAADCEQLGPIRYRVSALPPPRLRGR